MWPQLFSSLHQTLFTILIWMSATRLLSECSAQYEDWEYPDYTDTFTAYPLQNYEAFPFYDSDDKGDDDGFEKRPLVGMSRRGVDRLTPEEAAKLRERVKGLYAMLKENPTLMQRRLLAGSQKPDIPRHHETHLRYHQDEKRSFNVRRAEPVCPSKTEWRLVRYARDINDTEVEVFQPNDGSNGHQWFYTTTCDHDHEDMFDDDCPRCCRGIARHRYHSHCMPKKSFVMALVRRPTEQQYDWNWIQVDASCTCYISRH